MNQELQDILDRLPMRPPRSKLEPHKDLISQLRRKRCTYREIATFLKEHLGISVDHTTIFDFVQVRAKQSRAAKREEPLAGEPETVNRIVESTIGTLPSDPILDRFRAVRNEPVLKRVQEPVFTYDPDQPLERIKPKSKEK